jgi:ribose transport system ATP-binding protein
VLILDEPTRGIDVGAKAEIYELLAKMATQGLAVIIVSSELPELMGMCDRILVLSKGQLAGEVGREAFDEEHILSLAYQEYMSLPARLND